MGMGIFGSLSIAFLALAFANVVGWVVVMVIRQIDTAVFHPGRTWYFLVASYIFLWLGATPMGTNIRPELHVSISLAILFMLFIFSAALIFYGSLGGLL